MSDLDFDTVVIGAGAIGMAIGANLAERGQSVLVLEAGDRPGEVTTARNSEVIHAGLYYPTGTLKHRLCVSGRRQLYAFMDRTGVAYHKCGKLIVATDEAEEEKLATIYQTGTDNEVENLTMLSQAEVAAREPDLAVTTALWSPETGIFDSHTFVQRLLAILEDHGGMLVLRSPFAKAERMAGGFSISTGGEDPTTITAGRLVNAAGLWSSEVAQAIQGLATDHVPEQWYAKGCYFRLSGKSPFSHLIYPTPVDGGLGVHATLDLGGATRFGPDVEWLPRGTAPSDIDYTVSPERMQAFDTAIRRYWPGLPEGKLETDYSGVRPKLLGPGEGFFDFDIQTEAQHGVAGLVNLFGFESPGLTSSLAIGEAVAEVLHDS